MHEGRANDAAHVALEPQRSALDERRERAGAVLVARQSIGAPRPAVSLESLDDRALRSPEAATQADPASSRTRSFTRRCTLARSTGVAGLAAFTSATTT